jgi:hypothetical protein
VKNEEILEFVIASRRAQGLPDVIIDEAAHARVLAGVARSKKAGG